MTGKLSLVKLIVIFARAKRQPKISCWIDIFQAPNSGYYIAEEQPD